MTHVVVVGGGVAGLSVANALASVGLRSTVLEKTMGPGSVDRGDVLHHAAVELLQQWGAKRALDEYEPISFSAFRVLDNQGKRLFEVDTHQMFGPNVHFTSLRHQYIEEALEKSATFSGLVDVRRGEFCKRLFFKEDRIAGVETDNDRYLAHLTVLATGANSPLRDRYFPPSRRYEYPVVFYNASFRRLPFVEDAGYYIVGPQGVMIMVPLPRAEMRIGVQIEKSKFRGTPCLTELQDIIRTRLPLIPVGQLEFLGGNIYRLVRSLTPCWWRKGAVLVGDAAHTTHPVGGQGMNLAMGDAEGFVKAIRAHGLDTAEHIDLACQEYFHRRQREVRQVLRWTHVLGSFGSLQGRSAIALSTTLIRALNRIPPARRALFRRVVYSK